MSAKPQLVVTDMSGHHAANSKKPRRKKYDSAKYKQWYAANADKKLAYAKARYALNPQRHIDAAKKYRDDRPGCWVESHRKRLYGIDNAELERMLLAQENQCAICKRVFDDKKTKNGTPHIDHDHATGKVRGILCGPCNTALGRMERPGFLTPALKYLGISV